MLIADKSIRYWHSSLLFRWRFFRDHVIAKIRSGGRKVLGRDDERITREPLMIKKVCSYEEYIAYAKCMSEEHLRRKEIEAKLIANAQSFQTQGFCYVCGKGTRFFTDFMYSFVAKQGRRIPNWRERLVCPGCRLNSRMRASVQIFEQECKPKLDDTIYIAEQTTPLFRWFENKYRNVVGSEYLGEAIPKGGRIGSGIRNESLLNLSFSDEQFDHILCFDVFEHVPDYKKAFRECFRCLKPKGSLLYSVPFNLQSRSNIVRARVKCDRELEHFLPPEYHGDPMKSEGCLCYYHFGWESFIELADEGFSEVSCCFYWSKELGYLGGDQFMFIARK